MPVYVSNEDTIALGDDGWRVGLAVGRMRHRMPQMAGVFFLDEIVVVLANI
jgi:hypothetical protein